MINGSFVFGMDDDDEDVFKRTVDWAIAQGITTATFHIQTPYPGTGLHARLEAEGRITTRNWDLYDTRHVVYRPARLDPERDEAGLRLGVPASSTAGLDCPRVGRTRLAEAPGETLLLCGRVEEVRARLESDDPGAATRADDAAAGGGALAGDAGGTRDAPIARPRLLP